jgi:Ca2+-binding EF-hand superfamily protein
VKLSSVLAALVFTAALAQPVAAQTGRPANPATRPAALASDAQPVPRATFISTMDAEFRGMYVDKNNILTKKEIEDFQRSASVIIAQQRNAAIFQALDKDKNGSLSPGEFAALRSNLPPPNAAPVLAQTDANRDGSVTLVEYRAGKLVNFDRMDTDKDGVVSLAEMKAAGLIK